MIIGFGWLGGWVIDIVGFTKFSVLVSSTMMTEIKVISLLAFFSNSLPKKKDIDNSRVPK